MRERVIERYLVDKVLEAGAVQRKYTTPGRRGAPDRIIFWGSGQLCFAETKTKDGKLTAQQVHEHDVLRIWGFRVYVIRTHADVGQLIEAEKKLCLQ